MKKMATFFAVLATVLVISGIANAQSDLTAPLITTAPYIDGVVGSSEWSGAFHEDIDLTNNLGETQPTTWYFMNDGTYLYVGVETQTTAHWDTKSSFAVDGNNDNYPSGNPSGLHQDFTIGQVAPGGWGGHTSYVVYSGEGTTEHTHVSPSSEVQRASAGSSNVSYEYRIPLSSLNMSSDTVAMNFGLLQGGLGHPRYIFFYPYQDAASHPWSNVENWPRLRIDSGNLDFDLHLSATAADQRTYLQWSLVPDADQYIVRVSSLVNGSFVRLGDHLFDGSTFDTSISGENGVSYFYQVVASRDGVELELSNSVFSRPGDIAFAPPAPPNPILFIHGHNSDADAFADTYQFLADGLGWDPGGVLSHEGASRTVDTCAFNCIEPGSGFNPAGDYFAVEFGDEWADYGDPEHEGLDQWGMEIEDFVNALSRMYPSGRELSLSLVAHSNGGLAARYYLLNRGDDRTAIRDLVTYGTPHQGADFPRTLQAFQDLASSPFPSGGLLTRLLTQWGISGLADQEYGMNSPGAIDASFQCVSGEIVLSPFLIGIDDLLPGGINYSSITGHDHTFSALGPFTDQVTLRGERQGAECHDSHWDGLVPTSSADLSRAQGLVEGQVRNFATNRIHVGQGNDFTTILSALYPNHALILEVFSPIRVSVTAPNGRVISEEFSEIPSASYVRVEDGLDHETVVIYLPFAAPGNYVISVTPKPEADPTSTYTIRKTKRGETSYVAQDVHVRDIPQDGYMVNVNSPPIADAGDDKAIECVGLNGAAVTLNGSRSVDSTGTLLTYSWTGPFPEGGGVVTGASPTVTLPMGANLVSLIVSDELGNSLPDTVEIVVRDTTPPSLTMSVSPETLWPPNHKMVAIATAPTASDICDPEPSVRLVNISMDESEETLTYDPQYDDTIGDGHTTDDIEVSEDGSVFLRAERAGTGDGRVYMLIFEAADASGNAANASAAVSVPHSQ